MKILEGYTVMFFPQRTTFGEDCQSKVEVRGLVFHCLSGLLPEHTSGSEHGTESHPENNILDMII